MINTVMNIILMQGYGAYIWGSVFITLSILGGYLGYVRHQFCKMKKTLKEDSL